ncbi:phiSA1p31-related protein [Streptomyces sp. NPDC088183]|uniref:phiSA1p31-related protein n=1 Tax=Streptomyces sp. NPDC088183 TaxID=3160992 RepID=UPI00342B5617
MAQAQYETRTRTVEETFVVLTLTEDEADELREVLGCHAVDALYRIYSALSKPVAPEPETSAYIFEHQGVAYEYGAMYRDTEGDHFEFDSVVSTDGTNTPRGRLVSRFGDAAGEWNWSLGEVVHGYGPLTKVTA